MNRFQSNSQFRIIKSFLYVIPILLFITLFVLFFVSVNRVGQTSIEKQKESLDIAIHRDIVHCYAVEGVYPPSLDYLKEHYGLTYNEDMFFVDYQPIGSNILPDYTIILRSNISLKGAD